MTKGVWNIAGAFLAFLFLISWSIILYPEFWENLRNIGLPVPYCTTNDLAIGCEFKAPADYAHIHQLTNSESIVVTISGGEPIDFLNTICAHANSGNNVLAIITTVTSDSNSVAVSLQSCGVKVKRAYVRNTIAVSPSGFFVISPNLSLYTDCNKVVEYEYDHLKRRWQEI